MKIDISKSDVKAILTTNQNTFFTTKEVAAALKLTGDAVDRISTLLYRLRHDFDIERERSSATYKYRCVKPTKDIPLIEQPTTESRDNDNVLTQVKQERDNGLDKYCFLKQLEEVEFGCCDKCESEEIIWRAELTNGGIEFLCNNCGELVKEYLEANGVVVE